jgi:hypothetical protein
LTNFQKFNYEIFIRIKNKSDPALLPTSYVSNESIKRTHNSHEIIPLSSVAEPHHVDAAAALGRAHDAAPA